MRFPADVPTLTDGTVTLRPHSAADAQALYEQTTDALMLRWTTVPDPSTLADARFFATQVIPAGWREETAFAFAVDAPDDDGRPRFVGTVELRDKGAGRAEVAYGSHPWARGRGHVVRALELLLDWGFAERGFTTVVWWANKGNWASRKVAWRLGFSFDGTVRQWMPQRGRMYDGWVGSLLATDQREPRTPWLDVPVLTGERVVLRRYRDADAPAVQEACSDPRTRAWLADLPDPYTLDSAHAFLEARREQLATAEGISWAVADPADDRLLANISLFGLRPGHEAEIGYWTHPAARGRGVMTQACGLVVRHAFVPEEDGGLGLRRVRITAAEGNAASRRVIEANGFREVGRERLGSRLRDGSLADKVCYDLLAEEYDGRGA